MPFVADEPTGKFVADDESTPEQGRFLPVEEGIGSELAEWKVGPGIKLPDSLRVSPRTSPSPTPAEAQVQLSPPTGFKIWQAAMLEPNSEVWTDPTFLTSVERGAHKDLLDTFGAQRAATLPYQVGTTPLAHLPEMKKEDIETLASEYNLPPAIKKTLEIEGGFQRSTAHLLDFFSSPIGIGSLGIGGLPTAAQRAIALAFTADMLRSTPEIARAAGDAAGRGDTGALAEHLGSLGLNSAFIVAAGAHGLKPGEKAATEMPPPKIEDVERARRLAEIEARVTGTTPPVPEVLSVPSATAEREAALAELRRQRDELQQTISPAPQPAPLSTAEIPPPSIEARPGNVAPSQTVSEIQPVSEPLPEFAQSPAELQPSEFSPQPFAQREAPGAQPVALNPTPVEAGPTPAPAAKSQIINRKSQIPEPPWDIIDELQSNLGGKINLGQAEKLIEDFKPRTEALKKSFTKTGGYGPDVARQSIEHWRQFDSDEEFLGALLDAEQARRSWKESFRAQEEHLKQLAEEETQKSKAQRVKEFEERLKTATETVGEPLKLEETPMATAANLDKASELVHGRGYAELEPWQQEAIRIAVERGGVARRIPGRELADYLAGRQPGGEREPTLPERRAAQQRQELPVRRASAPAPGTYRTFQVTDIGQPERTLWEEVDPRHALFPDRVVALAERTRAVKDALQTVAKSFPRRPNGTLDFHRATDAQVDRLFELDGQLTDLRSRIRDEINRTQVSYTGQPKTHPLTRPPAHPQTLRESSEPETRNPELTGMGGAVPSEFRESPRTPTGIRNAIVDQERASRGLPPVTEPLRRTFGTVWDDAMSRIDTKPETQDALIAELKAHPRALTDTEDALLLHRQIDLQNQYGRQTRELAQAFDDAQRFPDRLEAVAALRAEVQRTSDLLLELYDVNKRVGTETGRGLAARKMLAYEDFTLAKMEMEARVAKGGEALTDAERTEITRLQQRIETTQRAFDEYRAQTEAAQVNRTTDEAIAELKRKVEAQPTYDPRVLQIAETIVSKLETAAVSASARLKAKLARLSAGVDPTIVYDLGVIGAAKIARLGLNEARFAAEMIKEFGEKVRPYLADAWTRANLHLENEGAKYGDKAPQVKNILRRRDEFSRRGNIAAGLQAARAQNQPLELIGRYARALAESFIRVGVKEREPLIDDVHDFLRANYDPAITRRQTMDAISGYGDFKPLNPDPVKVTLRDLKGQMQQLAKLEDIQAKRALPRTGVEHRTASGEERRLIQQVNEAKRRFGVVVTDPARQLKSALDAIKTRLRNSIADLEYQLNTRARVVKTKTDVPLDLEAATMKLKRDALRQQLDDLVPRPDRTPEQQLALVTRNVERSIAEYEQRIAGGETNIRKAKPAITSPQLEALRARRDALRAEWQELRALDPQVQAEAHARDLADYKRRLTSSTANYADRAARGDFQPRPRRQIGLDPEAIRLKALNDAAKTAWYRTRAKWQYQNLSRSHKIWEGIKETANLPRTIWTAYDVSAVLRQGGWIAFGHPVRAFQSIGPMFRALASEHAAAKVQAEIESRPNATLYARSKLYLMPLNETRLTAMEEQIMSRIAQSIPGVRASNRAFITFLNKLRADSFDAMFATLGGADRLNQPELEAISNYINVATGRGNLYQLSRGAETLATVFFAPRLAASRFQLLAGQPLYHGSTATRLLMAKEYARLLTGASVIIGLGLLAGANVERDPRSSDFLKLRFGDTRVDLFAGLTQASTLLSRLASGKTKTGRGDLLPIRGEVPYGGSTAADVIARFLRTKLSPTVGTAVDLLSGQNVVGEPATIGSAAKTAAIPLSFRDIYDAMQQNGLPAATAMAVLSLFGAGLQSYHTPDAADVLAQEISRQSKTRLATSDRQTINKALAATIREGMRRNPAYSNQVVMSAELIRLLQEHRRTNAPPALLTPK